MRLRVIWSVKEGVGEGWSLVRHYPQVHEDEEEKDESGGRTREGRVEVGLLPSSYYAVSNSDFAGMSTD